MEATQRDADETSWADTMSATENGKAEAAAIWVPTAELKAWRENPRKNDHAVPAVMDSIKRFGFASPIIARPNGEVIAGHTRLKAALELRLDRVPVRYMDLDPADAKLLAIADNRSGELADWDDEGLAAILRDLEAEEVDLSGIGWDLDEIDAILNSEPESTPYTAKIEAPVYEMTGERPDESELTDQAKAASLLAQIIEADIDPDARSFLLMAAARHTVFRYDKIAEYYAHAPPAVQHLMEESALVIVDFDRAIELGFVKLTKDLAEAYRGDYE